MHNIIRIMLQSHSHYTVLYMYIYCILCFHLFVSWSLTLWELCFPIHTVSLVHLVYTVYCIGQTWWAELSTVIHSKQYTRSLTCNCTIPIIHILYIQCKLTKRGGAWPWTLTYMSVNLFICWCNCYFLQNSLFYRHTHLLYIHTETTIYITRFLHIAVPLFNLIDAGIANVLYTESCVSRISLSGSEWNKRLTSAEIKKRDTRALYCGHEITIHTPMH